MNDITATIPRHSHPVDQMDTGLDLLVTAETALYAESSIDIDTIRAIRCTIEQALKFLRPARNALDLI